MTVYYILFIILSFFAYKEINQTKPLNLNSFVLLLIIFSAFIGLRSEVGCDWTGYQDLFNRVMCTKSGICQEFNNTFEYLKFKEIGFSSLNLIIKEIGGNFYHLNFILSILFIFPILSFC